MPTAPSTVQASYTSNAPTAPVVVLATGAPSAPTAPVVVQAAGVPSAPSAPVVVQATGAPSAPTAPVVVQATGGGSAPTAPESVQGVPAAPVAPVLSMQISGSPTRPITGIYPLIGTFGGSNCFSDDPSNLAHPSAPSSDSVVIYRTSSGSFWQIVYQEPTGDGPTPPPQLSIELTNAGGVAPSPDQVIAWQSFGEFEVTAITTGGTPAAPEAILSAFTSNEPTAPEAVQP